MPETGRPTEESRRDVMGAVSFGAHSMQQIRREVKSRPALICMTLHALTDEGQLTRIKQGKYVYYYKVAP